MLVNKNARCSLFTFGLMPFNSGSFTKNQGDFNRISISKGVPSGFGAPCFVYMRYQGRSGQREVKI